MKMKKVLSWLLVLVLCIGVLPMSVMAAEVPNPFEFDAPIISDLAISEKDTGGATLTFTLKNPDNIKEALAYYNEHSDEGAFWAMVGDISIDGSEWMYVNLTSDSSSLEEGTYETRPFDELHIDNEVKLRMYYTGWDVNADLYGGWYGNEMGKYSNVLTLNEKVDINASEWAKPELEKAKELGLIPAVLDGADLTQSITRAEFAAVSVKAYEKLSGVSAISAVNNPFTDTQDVEVLKAYNTGITSGVSADKFDPTALLNREQAATMLTRVFKKVSLAGWTLATDSNFTLPYEKPAAFTDDKDISDWAKDSVYFMAANKIIAGVGDNKFAPKNVTTQDEATGYANATREQALIIAVRMVENLK